MRKWLGLIISLLVVVLVWVLIYCSDLAEKNYVKAQAVKAEYHKEVVALVADMYYAHEVVEAQEWMKHQHEIPFQIASDPSNYGWHNIGHREGMCEGFAINLLNRLQHEAPDVTAEMVSVRSWSNTQPAAPRDPEEESGGWEHAFVVFWTWWDDRCYVVDQNVGYAVEVDLNRVDWTQEFPEHSFLNECIRTLWSHLKTSYPFAWDSLDVFEDGIYHDKREVLDEFGPNADGYFKMQGTAYYFPPDWCVD